MTSGANDKDPLAGLPSFTLDEAAALVASAREQRLVDEAELAAAGYRHLTVEHGDLEDQDQVNRITQLSNTAWRVAAGRISTRGGNDYRTFEISPPRVGNQPSAEELIDQLEQLAHQLNPGWWRTQRSTH